MTIQKSINLAIAGFIATLAGALMLVSFSVSAQDAETEEATPVTTQEETTEENTEESGTYDYVAQSGDSYSLMARKAVQTYGVINNVSLSGAQILFAETNLTLQAGSPTLSLGENVSISESSVAEWVEKAQELTEEQQAEWQVYVSDADFNTDSVGEVRE